MRSTDTIKLDACIEAMINLELDSMVWEFRNCPIEEISSIYVPHGEETHVVLAKPENEYIARRIHTVLGLHDVHQVVTLKLNEEYYVYILADADGPLDEDEEDTE